MQGQHFGKSQPEERGGILPMKKSSAEQIVGGFKPEVASRGLHCVPMNKRKLNYRSPIVLHINIE